MAPTAISLDSTLPSGQLNILHADLNDIGFTNTIKFYLNGKLQIVRNPNPEGTLLDYIRREANLTGTKLGCSEGGCGACTITLAYYDNIKNKITYQAVNSCIVPLLTVDGKHLITVEGLGTSDNPHPVQERIAKFHGSQCGFCTPGIVMSLYSLLREKNGHVSKEEISEALDGNLCRCTGYMPIIDACNSFAYNSDNFNKHQASKFNKNGNSSNGGCGSNGASSSSSEGLCARGEECCRNKKKTKPSESTEFPETEIDMNQLFTPNGLPLKPYKPEDDLQFPNKLESFNKLPIFYGDEERIWFRPTTKLELLKIYKSYPKAKLVGGSSEVQVEIKMKNSLYNTRIYTNEIDELRTWEYIDGKGLLIGANISLSELEYLTEDLAEKLDPLGKGQVFKQISEQLKYFAGRQIRNAATPAGNIVTASPIADLNPVLIAAHAIITTEKINHLNQIETNEFDLGDNFFIGYRKHKLPENAIVTKIFIPETAQYEYIHAYKQSKRKDDDIAIVTSCLRIKLDSNGNVEDSSLVYGGMAPMTVNSPNTENFIKGKDLLTNEFVESCIDSLNKEFDLKYNVPGGMATYRKTLTLSFFFKFWKFIIKNYLNDNPSIVIKDVSIESAKTDDALNEVTRNDKKGHRDLDTPFEYKLIGKSNPHLSALKQVTGEAQYTDDIPPQHGELFAVQVLCEKAHAKIVSVDWSAIYDVETVTGYIDINDLPSKEANYWGPLPFGKESFLADSIVEYYGQTIGVVLATDREKAYEASRLVKVEYEELPSIISVEDGVKAKSFFPDERSIELGDCQSAFKNSKYVFEGEVKFGAQEHFYFETQGSLVIPEEDGEMKVYASTQNPTETQEYAARVTGVPSNRIVVRTKRLGGGFGGKESRSVQFSSLCCIAAKKFKKPIRMILSRYEDMLISGQRHPFYMKYKVSLDENYKFTGLDINLYANAGFTMDLTRGVIDRAVFHACNCYFIPNARICGIPVKTNTASNTAYRGFGGPQGMYAMESIIVNVSEQLQIDSELIRDINYFNKGDITPYKQLLSDDFSIPDLVKQNKSEHNYDELKKEVERFNESSKYIKRGIAHIPTMFGIAFGVLFLNQAGALVNIYHDGSVLVSQGGVEIGQGLFTKMTMVAAAELGVPVEKVFISETSTQCVPNTSPTAASSASDINGMAIKNACDKLNERLKPIKEKLGPDATWHEIVSAAYFDRISLSATGFYKMPEIGFVFGDPNPKPAFLYYTQGSAITVVEVDTLTGDWACLEADIKMDIGRPINQAIDYGQIEGAFIQGMGLFTMEQSLWFRHNGALFTRGPGNYKIPGFRDVPQKFDISMLKDREFTHLKTIRSSKGIGEPPLFLGSAVHFALRDAINSARKSNGIKSGAAGLPFKSPLTTERIRNAMGDFIVNKSEVIPKDESEKDFFVEA